MRHRRVIMLSSVHQHMTKLVRAPIHRGDNWRDLHKVWSRAGNVDDFEHIPIPVPSPSREGEGLVRFTGALARPALHLGPLPEGEVVTTLRSVIPFATIHEFETSPAWLDRKSVV